MTLLSIRELSVFNRLNNITATVSKGTVVHLLGENGAGKSSLLLAIAGLLPLAKGQIIYQERNLTDISLAELATFRCVHLQGSQPVFDLSVSEYLRFYQHPANSVLLPQPVEQALEINHLMQKRVTTLSGGELQRVELGRCFLQVWSAIENGQALIVLDEPLQALDIRHQIAILEMLNSLAKIGNSVLLSSHHISLSARYADSIWCIQDGKVIGHGPADEVITPHILKRTYKCNFDVKRHQNSWQIEVVKGSDF